MLARSSLLAFCALSTLVTLTGCATTGTAAREVAAQQLACPSDAVHVRRVDDHIFVATGCGSSVEVACYDPYASTGAAKGLADGATAGNRVRCETLLERKPTLTSAPPRAPAPAAAEAGGFDKALAAKLLAASADRARTCGQRGGPDGAGHARVTFAADGAVSNVDVEPPFRDTEVGRCVARELARTSLPAFSGGPTTVRKAFEIPAGEVAGGTKL
jgi:hypothetical protein